MANLLDMILYTVYQLNRNPMLIRQGFQYAPRSSDSRRSFSVSVSGASAGNRAASGA
ncbi:hypothetical protein SBBP2_2540002 [Burkholderiales bacterium]|nr:hypothetical protein SBBP2_2540002 [Burkholderiales bacterium]